MSTLDLTNSRLLGKGSSRLCYLHPQDPGKCVKVTYIDDPEITRKEMRHYRRFLRRGISWEMLARSYGIVETTMGPGAVFSLAYDFDGQISRTLDQYLASESLTPSAKQLASLLGDMKRYMLRERVVVRELKADNFVFQRTQEGEGRLVLIDGIGNNQFLPMANYMNHLARRVIRRKWDKFELHLLETFPDNGTLRQALQEIRA